MAKKKGKWIQGAIKRPGDLRAKAKRAGAITRAGTIRVSWLRQKAKGNDRTAQQARLALKMRSMKKR